MRAKLVLTIAIATAALGLTALPSATASTTSPTVKSSTNFNSNYKTSGSIFAGGTCNNNSPAPSTGPVAGSGQTVLTAMAVSLTAQAPNKPKVTLNTVTAVASTPDGLGANYTLFGVTWKSEFRATKSFTYPSPTLPKGTQVAAATVCMYKWYSPTGIKTGVVSSTIGPVTL